MKTIIKINKPSSLLTEEIKAFLLFLMLMMPQILIAYEIKIADPGIAYFLLLFAGWFTWTFIEYYNHRFRMHSSANPSKVVGYESHMLHHHHPTEIKITGLKRLITIIGNIVLAILCVKYKNSIIFVTGFYTGFTIYTLMHWFLHRRISAKLFPELNRFHVHHHCKHPEKCFGVTVTWWDHMLGTVPHQQKEITDRIKSFYYKR